VAKCQVEYEFCTTNYLDKLIDELAKGKAMEKILRQQVVKS